MKNLDITTDSLALPVNLVPLVQEYMSGSSVDDLALRYNMPSTTISEFLDRKEVKRFIKTELQNYKMANRKRRINLLSRIVDEKIIFAEENEMPLSNKDIIEVLKLLREESKDIENFSADEDNSANTKNTYVQIINELKN